MNDKLLTEMDEVDVEALMTGFIERSSQTEDEMPANVFFDLLFDVVAEQTQTQTEIEGEIINGELILRLPSQTSSTIQVRGNHIVVGKQRIIVNLKQPA